MPIDKRIKPSLIPAFSLIEGGIEACVMTAGTSTKLQRHLASASVK